MPTLKRFTMYPVNRSLTVMLLVLSFSCNTNAKEKSNSVVLDSPTKNQINQEDLDGLSTAYFASGCFWCVEAVFESVRGVKEVVSGYAGGIKKNPSYEEVAMGLTKHAETVKVYYDPELITFLELVQVFFGSHDPTTLNQQGPDKGAQYRSIAFYQTRPEKEIIEAYIKGLKDQKVFDRPIVTEVKKLKTFYEAEDYHQDFERNNPNNRYVQQVSIPRLHRFQERFPELLKENASKN